MMDMLDRPLSEITQGSIVDNADFGMEENALGIVLSNACDFLNDKMGYILISCLVPATNVILESKEFKNKIDGVGDDRKISKTKWGKIKPFLDNYIFNKGISRYFFIDPRPILDCPLLFVDFQHIVSIPFEQNSELENVAQLQSPYREQMIVHFASYTARIPVDRNDKTDELARSLIGSNYTLDI